MINIPFFALLLAFSAPTAPPFTVDATENVSANFPGAPRVESSAFGQWKGRWVFIGGRIAGYHSMGGSSAEFPRADANREIWVVDSTVQPAHTYHVPVDSLPAKLAPLKDEWVSTGQLYYQDGPSLYIAGGYGQDSSGHWVTFPVISKIDLPGLIDGVMQAKPFADSIALTSSTLVQSAGGDLMKLPDNYFYVVMGHVFMGTYTAFEGYGEHSTQVASQAYLNEIRKLQIAPAGNHSLSVTLVQNFKDETEFHRRDLNVAKILSPNGVGLAAYGGVFTPDTQLSYSKPVYLFRNGPPHIDSNFDQKMNAYHCAKLLLYDKSSETMYTTFFGGISRYAWDPASQQFVENARVGDRSSNNYLDGMQWSNQISTLRRVMTEGKEETSETVQPNPLPSYIGTEALFIPVPGLAHASGDADIIDLTALPGKKTLVGYLYGGIRAFPFHFPYTEAAVPYSAGAVPTKPSDLILKVYLEVSSK